MKVVVKVSCMSAAAGAMSLLAAGAQGQIFTSSDLAASEFTISTFSDTAGAFDTDVRGAVDYSSIDIYGDGFLTASLPEAPNSAGGDTATTGLFLSANNTAVNPNTAGVAAFINGVNVGNGTANEDYKLQFDVYHSTGTGLISDNGTPGDASDDTVFSLAGTTNYQFAGVNYNAPVIEIGAVNDGGQTGGNGIGLAITADSGAAEDYASHYNNILHGARARNDAFDFEYSQAEVPDVSAAEPSKTFLAQEAISIANSNEADFFNDPGSFPGDNGQAYYQNNAPFATITGQPNYALGSPVFDNENPTHELRIADNDEVLPTETDPGVFNEVGTPYNRWTTHELYWVDDVFTYAIDGVPVMQVDTVDEAAEFDALSTAGQAFLGFYDRFTSIASSPDGANFAVYDNILVEEATAGDVPDFAAAIAPFITGPGLVGDYNGDGFVSQGDLDLVLLNWGDTVVPAGFEEGNLDGGGPFDGLVSQNELDGVLLNWGNGTPPALNAVPEPTSLALLGLGGLALATRRRA